VGFYRSTSQTLQQRDVFTISFAVAIHTEPEILLVDEILAVGDASFQQKCFEKIEELKNSE
jgi:ABC-type polysaccharide/polyol phosphate transport system ATPase subunit